MNFRKNDTNETDGAPDYGKKLKKTGIGVVTALLVILIGFSVVGSAVVRIPVGSIGVETRLSKATGKIYTEGVHLVLPFVTRIEKFNARIMDMPEITTQGELSGQEPITLTIESKYRIDTSKVVDIYRTAGTQYRDYLIPQSEMLDVVKSVISRYDISEFAGKRAAISSDVLTALNDHFSERGIIFTSFAIPNYNFDAALEEAIAQKNVATQKQKTQAIEIQTEKERAQADKEIALLNAERDAAVKLKEAEANAEAIKVKAAAEAEANKKIAQSVTPELVEYLEIEKWNGSKATVITSGSVITDVSGN